jgi:zinc and cadmium transporter
MNWWEYLLLFALPVAGGLVALNMRSANDRHIRLLLAFSGAFLFGITIIHLMPMAFHYEIELVGLYILAGFLLQLLLEYFSKGVEHGHIHSHEPLKVNLALSIMIGLSVHAFMEGIPLGGLEHQGAYLHDHGHSHDHHGHTHDRLPLLLGIVLHKAPAGFALMAIFVTGNVSRFWSLFCLVMFALMSPLAAFLTDQLASGTWGALSAALPYIMALVIGSFMHLSTTILFEVGSKAHSLHTSRLIAILVGLVMAVLASL